MFAILSTNPDRLALSFFGLIIAFVIIPYFGQIDLTMGIAPTLETIGASMNN